VVVDAEVNRTRKTTLRSERSCVPEKRKERTKNKKKFLTRAGIVRDVRFGDKPGLDQFRMSGIMTNGEICLPRDLIAHLDDAVRVLLG